MEIKSTENLLKSLEACSMEDVIDLTDTINAMPEWTFCRYFKACLNAHNTTLSQIPEAAGMQRTYIYQIYSGRRNPGRDKVIAISLAAGFTLDETQRLLKLSGNGILYPKNARDALLIKSLMIHLSVMEVNALLDELNFNLLQ